MDVTSPQQNAAVTASNPQKPAHMPALTGIRFFAIFHIFIYHLWTLHTLEEVIEPFDNLFRGFEKLPGWLVTYCSNGWMSTSFFFLLSGFILSYLYWSPEGSVRSGQRNFWVQRFTRIFPIHIILTLVTAFLMTGSVAQSGGNWTNFVFATLSTLTLTQAWVPPWVPVISWPAWTLSALIFLYLITPWLMRQLAKLSTKQLTILLIALPVISLLPTALVMLYVPDPSKLEQNWSIFVGSTPLFWVPHFAVGMVLARLLGFQRDAFSPPERKRWFSWGDLAIILVIGLCLTPNIGDEPMKYYLRHGVIMPLYMVVIVDLAKGHGLFARLFSLPGTGFLGETGFSIFIWQNLVMIGAWISLMINPNAWVYQLEVACVSIVVIGIISTYYIERPLAKAWRKKLSRNLGTESTSTLKAEAS